MKKTQLISIILILFLAGFPIISFSQGIIISDNGTTTPDNSAMLEIQSTSKGLLIPRMTSAQRSAISNPKEGLLVFDSDKKSFFIYGQSAWNDLSTPAGIWQTSASNVYLSSSYTNVGVGTQNPNGKFVIQADAGKSPSDPLFEIRDNLGKTIMSVTSEGVRMYVKNYSSTKGVTGGFAVGQYGTAKGNTTILFASSDSARVYTAPGAKGVTGGFAVGQYGTAKGPSTNYMQITQKNSFIGYGSGSHVNFGSYNCTLGYEAGKNIFNGGGNVLIGHSAGTTLSNGAFNVFIGRYAGFTSSTGSGNIFIGEAAGYNATSGINNIGIGPWALNTLGYGENNVCMGMGSLYVNSVGHRNVGMGTFTLHEITSGSNNTAIGFQAYLTGDYSNSTAVGSNTSINASNQVRVGDASVNSIGNSYGIDWTITSDKRFKDNIKENVPGLDFILKLKPVTYNLNTGKINDYIGLADSLRNKNTEKIVSQTIRTGFLAQDVEFAANSIGFDFDGVDKPKNEKDFYGLRYAEFVVPLVKAVQEQQVQIEKLENRIKELEAIIKK